ncbi:rho-related GTP-binding protein RhoA-B-like [Babylonia areolata]|uniref:rho-related GTP-binding protein RhoA-B-like n=1 Tax=Babylonia areolata TaxID=304850 RepID=UPI003FD0ED0D
MMSWRSALCWGCGCANARGEEDDCEELTRNVHVTSKVMVVGDGEVGKTSLLMRYVHNEYREEYRPTIFENQAVPVSVHNKKVLLSLFDTAGQEDYDYLRPLMYPETDIVLICFSVEDRASLRNVKERWQPEVRAYLAAKVPILLVGLKTDLRSSSTHHHLHPEPEVVTYPRPEVTYPRPEVTYTRQPLLKDDASPGVVDLIGEQQRQDRQVSYSEGQKMAERIGAKAYFECSSKENQGLTAIFYEAARLSLKQRRVSSLRKALSLSLSSSRGRPVRSFWRAA